MWHRDEGAEQLMEQIGIKFELRPNIPITKLKIKESLENNARFGSPLDDQRVQQYAYAMQAGVRFPSPVLSGDFLIYAGNQRANAAIKSNRSTIDAYIITKATQDQIDDFIRRDNIRHGKSLTDEEKVQTCVELHRKHHKSIRELNDLYFGGNDKTYARIVAANQAKAVEDKLLSKNVVAVKLPTSTLASMHPIANDINVLRDTAILALDFSLSSSQVDDIIKEIKEKPTEAERHAVVRSKRVEIETKSKGGRVQPEVTLRKAVVSFRKTLENGFDGKAFPPLEKLVTDKDVKKQMIDEVNRIIDQLKHLKEKVK